mgnify:CR=1 FL=1
MVATEAMEMREAAEAPIDEATQVAYRRGDPRQGVPTTHFSHLPHPILPTYHRMFVLIVEKVWQLWWLMRLR